MLLLLLRPPRSSSWDTLRSPCSGLQVYCCDGQPSCERRDVLHSGCEDAVKAGCSPLCAGAAFPDRTNSCRYLTGTHGLTRVTQLASLGVGRDGLPSAHQQNVRSLVLVAPFCSSSRAGWNCHAPVDRLSW